MFLSLEIQTASGGSYNMSVGSAEVEVGRSAACDVRLPYPAVSNRHLRFVDHGETWTVTDLQSKNGTTLDGRPLPPSKPATVEHGSVLQIGEVRLVVRFDDEESAGFTLTESGTMLRKLLADSVGPAGAELRADDGSTVAVPDYATDLRVEPAEFRIDRRGHGFWVTALDANVSVDGTPLPPDGAPLRDGQTLRGSATWVFQDPLEAHVRALDDSRLEEQPAGGANASAAPRGAFERIVLFVGAVAALAGALGLLVIFEIL